MSRKLSTKAQHNGGKAFNIKSAYPGKKKKLRQKKVPRAKNCHLCCRTSSPFHNFQDYVLVLQALKAPAENNRY